MADQLGEFVARTAQQLNAAHNASSASRRRTTLSGRNTGLDLPTAVSGFTGTTTVAITNASGVVQKTVAIDFTGGTMSVNGGPSSGVHAGHLPGDAEHRPGRARARRASRTARSRSPHAGGNGVAIDAGHPSKAARASRSSSASTT